MNTRHRCFAILVVAIATTPRIVQAQGTDTERARAFYDEAGELERQGQWVAAQDRLRSALRIRETPHLRYALGWALENDDKLLAARVEYETARRLAERTTGADEVIHLAQARLEALEIETPTLIVRVHGGVAQLYVDAHGVELGRDNLTVPVDPGSHVVRVVRRDRPALAQSIYVSRGVVRVIDVGDDEVMIVAEHGSRLPWVLVGGGAALVLGGVALFAASSSDASARDHAMQEWCAATACTNGDVATRPETTDAAAFRREAEDASTRGNTKQVLGAILGGAGLVGVGIGTYMLVRAHGDAPRAAKLQLDAAPTVGGMMTAATLRF